MFDAPQPLIPQVLALHGKWHRRKPAIVTDEGTLSWSAFDCATARVANGLAAMSLPPGSRIGIVMSNCQATVEVIFATLRAGHVAVPINLSVSDEAMLGMLEDAGVGALFATGDQVARLTTMAGRLPSLVRGGQITTGSALPPGWISYIPWRDGQDADNAIPAINPEAPANIIYSSGTTGMPKGIVHSHIRRLNWAYDAAIALRYHGGARSLITIGLYSNVSWVIMLCTLIAGGTLYVRPRFDPQDALATIQRDRITHTAMVPIQYQRLLEAPAFANYELSSMQAMMSCGSALLPHLKAALFKAFPCGVIELYGLTEGIITTIDPEDADGRLASVGKPLMGTDIRLIGDDGNEVANGQAGEIVSRGRITMPGYWNRDDATDEATWTDNQDKKWIRSGDIGRLDEDGFLYIVDRKKDMILSGGQNIYPADIEATLATHPDVAECAVIGVPDAAWGETPFAVVVPSSENVDSEVIRQWLNARIGKQQRVKAVALRDSLPRNPNGKILKRELRREYAQSS